MVSVGRKSRSNLGECLSLRVFHQAAIKASAGAVVTSRLDWCTICSQLTQVGVGNLYILAGCWSMISVPCHMDLYTRLTTWQVAFPKS